MGNFSSQHFEEWLDSTKRNSNDCLLRTEDTNSTPPNKRCLPTDPRSPSSDIRRTPIVVDQTPKKFSYTAVSDSDKLVDENEGSVDPSYLDLDEIEKGEEVNEYTRYECRKSSCSNAGRLQPSSSTDQRPPLKMLSKRNIDSPVMYLRYKQIRDISGYIEQFNKQVEMSDVACNYEK